MTIVASNITRIRQALLEDLPRLMNYIDTEWKPGHILSRDRDFFCYEYQSGHTLNFIVSENELGAINGMLGFIPSSTAEDSAVWTTMWKVSCGTGNPILGIQLLQYLKARGHRMIMSLGINQKTIGIYRYLRYTVGSMDHYFLPNRYSRSFQIAKIPSEVARFDRPFERLSSVNLQRVSWDQIPADFSIGSTSSVQPKKDLGYIQRRYFKHPIYSYRVYGIYRNNELATLLVSRVVHVETAKALRLVDIIGEESLLPYVTYALHEVLTSEGMEYMDLVSYGLDENLLKRGCFSKLDLSQDQIIIPNYFEPFVQENIPINFFVDCDISTNLRLFKADGDQDRPSLGVNPE